MDLYFYQNYRFVCLSFLIIIISSSCQNDENPETQTTNEILTQLQTNYTQLPEEQISISLDEKVYAQYAGPTTRYGHAILGDDIEASELIVYTNEKIHELKLEEDYVFEDIRPRLVDVDLDGNLEILCIRTHVDFGAGIAIYKIENEKIKQYAYVAEIGNTSRWLNIVAIDDLDGDGVVELAWIQTPHIGGILKVAKIESGEMTVLDETSLYSNHAIGQRNLCLSVLTENVEGKQFYVPTQSRNQIVGFSFNGAELIMEETIDIEVDFAIPLGEQYSFEGVVEGEDNCI